MSMTINKRRIDQDSLRRRQYFLLQLKLLLSRPIKFYSIVFYAEGNQTIVAQQIACSNLFQSIHLSAGVGTPIKVCLLVLLS